MSDAESIKAGASALIAWPSLAIVLAICRSWCRAVARTLPVNSPFRRSALTWRLVRAMSWRVGLFLLIGVPVLLAFGGAFIGGLSFAMFSYPLTMLSVWQHARRISRYSFESAAAESASPESSPRQQLVDIARSLDRHATNASASLDACYISQTAYAAGLQAKCRRPTIIEGFVLAAAALMIGSFGLSLALPVSSNRQDKAHTDAATPRGAAQPNPATPATLPIFHFSTRTEAATAQWNKLYPEAKASRQHLIAMQNAEDAMARFYSAIAAVKVDTVLDGASVTQDPLRQLQTLKTSATEMLSALQEYKEQTRIDLLKTRLTSDHKQKILASTLDGYRLLEAWAAAALQVADAGLTLRDLYSRGLPAEAAKQHFIATWDACYDAQEASINSAKATQKTADEILRK